MKSKDLVISIIIFFSACSNSALPEGIIKPLQMQQILWDVIKADMLADEITKRDSSVSASAQNIRLSNIAFKLHHTTRAEFEKSFNYYSRHPDMLKKIIDSLNVQQGRKNLGDTARKTYWKNPKIVE